MVQLGYATREGLLDGNIEANQKLEIKKGNVIKVYKYNDATLNGEHIYDEILMLEVLGIRKSKNGRRVKVKCLEFGYQMTMLIDQYKYKVEVVK